MTGRYDVSRQLIADVTPLSLGVVALFILAVTDADRLIAHALFFDASAVAWAGRGNLWMEEVLHTGGRYLIRLIALFAVAGWLASFRFPRLAMWRRSLGYLAACLTLVPLLVGGLKEISHVDCPWDLVGFGGDQPYTPWFLAPIQGLSAGRCFPGAHSSSAFALFALFFVWREQRPAWARVALVSTLVLGILFSVAQQSRGAHFLSHDVASAMIAWAMCASLYRWVFPRAAR